MDSYRGKYYDAVYKNDELTVTTKTVSLFPKIVVRPQYELFDPICVTLCDDHNMHMTHQTFRTMYDTLHHKSSWSYNGLKIHVVVNGDEIRVDIIRGTVYDSYVFTEEQWGKMFVPLHFVYHVNHPHEEVTNIKEKK